MARMSIKQMQEFKTLVGEAAKAFKELGKDMKESLSSDAIKKTNKELKESVREIKNLGDVADEMGDGFTHLKNMWKASPGQIGKAASAAQRWSKEMKSSVSAAGEMGGALNVASKAAMGLSGIVGGISKALLGMPGLVLMGVKAVIDTATSIDTYVKNMNKDFARMRGPEIMSKDIGKQFKDFNTAVTSIGDNLRDGFQVPEVKNFMEAITSAGVRIGTLNEKFYNYRDAVHVAAKASKVFGADVVAVGSFMGKMMIDLKMDLEDIDDAFVQVAFDAEKSGMGTDRFWTAVQNASASLSFYGSFIEGVSKNLKTFTQTQVTGAEESSNAVQQMTQLFGKNSDQANLALARLIDKTKGMGKLRDKFKEIAEAYSGKSKALEFKISATKDQEEIKKLRQEQKRYNMMSSRATKAATGDQLLVAQNMGLLADQAPELLMDLMKSITGVGLSTDMSGERLEAVIKGVEKLTGGQISQELVKQLYAGVQGTVSEIKNSVSAIKNFSDIDANILKTLSSDTSPEELRSVAQLLAKEAGIQDYQAETLVKSLASNEAFRNSFMRQINLALEGNTTQEQIRKNIESLIAETDAGTTLMKKEYKGGEISDKEAKEAYDDTYEKIRDQTLSIQDMKNIAKDGVKWQLGMLTGIVDISTGVSKLVGHFVGKKEAKEAMAALPKELQKDIKNRGASAVAFDVQGQKNKLTEQLKAQQATQTAIEGMEKKFFEIRAKGGGVTGENLGELTGILDGVLSEIKDGEQKRTLEDLKSSIIWSTKANGKMTDGNFKHFTDKTKKLSKEEQEKIQSQITVADDQLIKLKAIDSSSETIANLTLASLLGEEGGKDKLLKAVKERFQGKKATEEEVAKFVGAGFNSIKENLEVLKISKKMYKFPTATTQPLEEKKDVKDVMSGGLINVSRGDVVVDRDSLASALGGPPGSALTMLPEMASGAAVGGGGKSEINITVHATEKDLAQRIANEVRGVLYKFQVTGMA